MYHNVFSLYKARLFNFRHLKDCHFSATFKLRKESDTKGQKAKGHCHIVLETLGGFYYGILPNIHSGTAIYISVLTNKEII